MASSTTTAYAGYRVTSTAGGSQHQQYAPGYYADSYPVQYRSSSGEVSGEPSFQSSYSTSGQSYYSAEQEMQPTSSTSSSAARESSSPAQGPASGSTARRRQQNRLAQRALRQRKENHLRELESRIINARFTTRHLEAENSELEQQLQQLTLENESLRDTVAFDPYMTLSAGSSSQGYSSLAHDYEGSTLVSTSESTYTLQEPSLDDTLDPSMFDLDQEHEGGERLYGEDLAEAGLSAEDIEFYEEWTRSHATSQG